MKTTIKSLFGIGIFLPVLLVESPAFSQEVLKLTLEESLEYALENNVEAKNAKLETLIAKASITERRSAGLPQINGTFDVTHNAAIPVVFLPNEGPLANPDVDSDVLPVRFGVNYTSGLVFQLNQMIFDGSYFVGLKAAKTYKLLSEFDNQKTQVDVKESIKKAYFSVLVNDVRQTLVRANLGRLDTLLKETQALYEAGFAEKIDVSRIKVQRNNLQTEIEKVQAARDISVELLKLQMGLPMNYQIELSEKLQDLVSLGELEALLQSEGGRRVEVDQLETNLELVDLDIKYTTSLYIPNLDFFGTYQRNAAAQSTGLMFQNDRWFTGAFIGLRLQIPVFDGLLKSAQIRQKRYQMEQLQNQRIFIEDNIRVERFQAKTTLENNIRTFKVQEENRELALEVFRMAQIKYQEGVGSNLEVVEADSALKDAENNYFSALYDALIAKVDLEKALGIL
ncbi:Outer membrane efflux protein precursor [Mariniradius saccharolyticus AK6]|uniref:Outer membrane efflux protein n=1 Tax=Mariniradius saccharolyticus AK6 TaxID=1239962 RepID=M7XBH1_9BACT|nr:TolC family protein [Mariniradius saccharolyticus]EMS32239.1 Outer membrane efflux protein precursor [Mariniradius saccharolyticus AK6]